MKLRLFFIHNCTDLVASARFARKVLKSLENNGKAIVYEVPFEDDSFDYRLKAVKVHKIIQHIMSFNPNIVIFGATSRPWAYELAAILSLMHIKTLMLLSDLNIPNLSYLTDGIIVTSDYLKKRLVDYGIKQSIYVVDDIVEYHIQTSQIIQKQNSLILGWIGHEDNWNQVKLLKKWLKNAGLMYPIITVSSHPEAIHKWHLDHWANDLFEATVGALPIEYSEWNWCKSANRVATMLALGMPVIASPVPSYVKLAREIPAIKIAETEKDFIFHLKELENKDYRLNLIRGIPEKIATRFSADKIGLQWWQICQESLKLRKKNTEKLLYLAKFEVMRIKLKFQRLASLKKNK